MDKLFLSRACNMILNHIGNYSDETLTEVRDSLSIFEWQVTERAIRTDDFSQATYKIMTYDDHKYYKSVSPNSLVRSMNNKIYVVFTSDKEFIEAMTEATNGITYRWQWKYSNDNPGYEVTSRGDRRFSPFFQKVKYNDKLITAEKWYEQVIKPAKDNGTYLPGTGTQFMKDYLNKYRGLLFELAVIGQDLPFTDMFDMNGGQNKMFADYLNNYKNEIRQIP